MAAPLSLDPTRLYDPTAGPPTFSTPGGTLVIYVQHYCVCERHLTPWAPGDVTLSTILLDCALWSPERGLTCPVCYSRVRYATQDDLDRFTQEVRDAHDALK